MIIECDDLNGSLKKCFFKQQGNETDQSSSLVIITNNESIFYEIKFTLAVYLSSI